MDIKITVRNKLPICGDVAIVCNNSDYVIVWELDEEWSGYDTKTMRTVYKDGTYTDTVFTGNTVALPVVTVPGTVKIGLYAGDIRTSRAALIRAFPSITSDGGAPAAPSEDVYNQLMERMARLETPDWAQNDSDKKDYVKNRPGGYTKTTPGYDITWDGVVGDRTVVEYNNVKFVKVSDRVLTAEELVGATSVVEYNNGDEEPVAWYIDSGWLYSNFDLFVLVWSPVYPGDCIISVLATPVSYDDNHLCVFEETGIYFALTQGRDTDGIPSFFTASLSKAEESHVTVKIPGELTGIVGGYSVSGSSSVLLDETISKERFDKIDQDNAWEAEVTINELKYWDSEYICGTINGTEVFGESSGLRTFFFGRGEEDNPEVPIGLIVLSPITNKWMLGLYTKPTADCEVRLTQYTFAKLVTIPTESIDEGFVSDVSDAMVTAYEALSRADKAFDKVNKAPTKANPVFTGSFSQNRKINSVVGNYSHAEGNSNIASDTASHAEGTRTTASGPYSHAEGCGTTADGFCSHSEGYGTTSDKAYSHAEGFQTHSRGSATHTEGNGTTAGGDNAHAEGGGTIASGDQSHTEGFRTDARGYGQHVQGLYNIAQGTSNAYIISDYAHIVGNGTSDTNRSNAHTLDWSGNAWFAGDVYVGSTSGKDKDAGSKKLATEEYVDGRIQEDGVIIKSSTPNSTKKFKITVDDSGVISAMEVVE